MPIPGTRLPSHLQDSRRATWRRKLKRQRRPRRRKPLRKRRSRFSDGHHLANIGNYTSPVWPAGRTATTGVDSITFGRRAFLLACRPDLLTRRWIQPGALAYGSRKRCSHQHRIADFVSDPGALSSRSPLATIFNRGPPTRNGSAASSWVTRFGRTLQTVNLLWSYSERPKPFSANVLMLCKSTCRA